MSRVNNLDTKVETPLPQLRKSIEALQPGQKIEIEKYKGRDSSYKREFDAPSRGASRRR